MSVPKTQAISQHDRTILRTLAARVAEAAAKPGQAARRERWVAHNDLRDTAPLVLCFPEGAWLECLPPEEMQVDDPLLRTWETRLRMALYTHEVVGDDQVLEPVFNVAWELATTGVGMQSPVETPAGTRRRYFVHPYNWLSLESDSALGAYHISPALREREELATLVPQQVVSNADTSQQWLEMAHELFDGLLQVRRRDYSWLFVGGVPAQAVRLRGMEALMMDMYDDPEWVHAFIGFLADSHLRCLDALEQGGYLTLNNGCEWIGTGGLGYTAQLPGAGYDPAAVRLCDLWGGQEAQDLVGISGAMFAEFFLPYLKPIHERFGLSHFGCCEPVHDWLPHLKTIRNLRRISISPWADVRRCAEQLAGDYVFSYKPNPTAVCMAQMDETEIEAELTRALTLTREHGCVVEIIMKDLHTLRHDPTRLPRWVHLARRAVEAVYG